MTDKMYVGMKSADGKYTWDGDKWVLTGAQWQQPQQAAPARKRPNKWLVIGGVVLGLTLIGGVLQAFGVGTDSGSGGAASPQPTVTVTEQPTVTPTPTVTTPTPQPTTPRATATHSRGWLVLDMSWHQQSAKGKRALCWGYDNLGVESVYSSLKAGAGDALRGLTLAETDKFFYTHCNALG